MKSKVFTHFLVLLFLIPLTVKAQNLSPQKLSKNGEPNLSVFTFSFDNDVLLNTDRYYTNGFLFSLMNKLPDSGLFNHIFFPESKFNNYYSISLMQEIYTPENFSQDKIMEGDRPFSADLILLYNETSFSNTQHLIVKSFFSLGLIGPSALGKEVQNGIHSLLPHSSDVPGWEFQIPDGVMLQTGMSFEKKIITWKSLLINGVADFALGSPKTEFGMGIHFAAFSTGDYFNFPFYFNNRNNSFLFDFGVNIFSKFYDANLQGLPYGKKAPYIIAHPNIFLFKAFSGIKYHIDNWGFDINIYYLSPEFDSGKSHLWNRFSVSYIF